MSPNVHLVDASAATLLRNDMPDTGFGMAEAVPATHGEGMLPNITRDRDGMPGLDPMDSILARRTMQADQARPAVLAANGPLRPGRVWNHGVMLYGPGLAFW